MEKWERETIFLFCNGIYINISSSLATPDDSIRSICNGRSDGLSPRFACKVPSPPSLSSQTLPSSV
ncbi:hypothetical protein U1Q18_012700, partial [Sarracenia purpurea var. burkii]